MTLSESIRRGLPAFGAALRLILVFTTVLSVPLAVAQTMGLTAAQTTSWILALYGLPSLLSLLLAWRYSQPLLLTGNLFAIIFIRSLGNQISYPELIGAFVLAGAGVALLGALGLTNRLASWVPAPVVFGLLTGAVISFVVDIFNLLGEAPLLVGGTFLAYLLGRRYLGDRAPPIFPALAAGLAIAAATGGFGAFPTQLPPPAPIFTGPVFSLQAVATATPVLIVVIALQSNLPSLVFLRSQGYQPPRGVIDLISGLGTLVGSLFGPTAVSISLPATSLVAGPEAGERSIRHWAVYVSSAVAVLVGLLAGVAADLPALIPLPLLLTLAGLSLVGVLADALQKITQGPLLLGPLFAFVIALSDISLLGFGNYFWSLVIGAGISFMLERDGWQKLRDQA